MQQPRERTLPGLYFFIHFPLAAVQKTAVPIWGIACILLLDKDVIEKQMRFTLNSCPKFAMAFIIGLHAGMQFAWEVTEPTEVKL